MRAVVWQHESEVQLGLLEPALVGAGFTVVRRFREVEHDDVNAELVVVLGGYMSVNDADAHPFLLDAQAVLAERLALERPSLGICLGAQLLAAAAGATVSRGKNGVELGVGPVKWTKAAGDDEVTAPLGSRTITAHWHHDTFSPVPQATLLASTDRYSQQAFKLGSSYAFQFHPEVNAAVLEGWLRHRPDDVAASKKTLEQHLGELGKLSGAEATWRELCARLAHHFSKVARQRSP